MNVVELYICCLLFFLRKKRLMHTTYEVTNVSVLLSHTPNYEWCVYLFLLVRDIWKF